MYYEAEFFLNRKACDALRRQTPTFGYNGFGEIVYYRTYSRLIKDDFGNTLGQEGWHDTVIRVINGIMSIRKDWYVKNGIQWREDYWQRYSAAMAESMFRMNWLPPGRGLWACGTDLIRERGAMALYNCAFSELGIDWVEDLCWAMDSLMYGVGVGFRPRRTDLQLTSPRGTYIYVIPDTREGWVESVRRLLNAFVTGGPLPVFDDSLVRPYGSPIKSFGGEASGPEPLRSMHETMIALCTRFIDDEAYDEVAFKTDLGNLIGVCVVSGNVRRSAEIMVCEVIDPVFTELKDYKQNAYRKSWGWMSNNSVWLEADEDFEHMDMIAQKNIKGHDLGYLNGVNIKKGRIGKKAPFSLDEATGMNPCQHADAWVLTPNGLRQFKDVVVDSLIWSETGWVRIVKKISTGINKVFRFHTTAGTFYGTENHELVSEGFKCEAKLCVDVDTLLGPKTESIVWDKNLVIDGLVIGDGTNNKGRVALNIGENDQDYFDEFGAIIGEFSFKKLYYVDSTVKPEEIVRPENRSIPNRFLKRHDVCSLLRGLFSANGSVINQARVSLKTTSIKIVEQIQMLLSSVGIRSYYTTNKPTVVKHKNGHFESLQSYDISTCDLEQFSKLIGFVQKYKVDLLDKALLTRFKSKYAQKIAKSTYDIISVDLHSEEETFDITVDNHTHTYWTQGLNVSNCGEIPLEDKEVCNVDDTLPTRCHDVKQWLQACDFATFYCSTVALLPTHQPDTNRVVVRNRRIGVGLVDFTGWVYQIGLAKVISALKQGYKVVRATNKHLADEAGVCESIRVTTVKPGGTTTKIAARTPGAGYPTFWHTIRRINIGVGTPVDRILEGKVPYEDSVYTPNTRVYEYPILQGPAPPATEVSLYQQAMNVVLLQREWADNMVSNTLYFKPRWSKVVSDQTPINNTFNWDGILMPLPKEEVHIFESGSKFKVVRDLASGTVSMYRYNPDHEEDQIEDVLSYIAPLTKSVSLLPHSDVGIFAQMPEEGITEAEYERRLAELKPIDWNKFEGSDGEDEKYCVGDSCVAPK